MGCSKPRISLMSVDLPAPFGPRIAVNDPDGIEKLASSQMAFDPYPAARPRAAMAAAGSFIA